MTNTAPIALVGWHQTDDEWRAERHKGCGASDVAALLGFSRRRSPWQVWAEKTGHPMAPVDQDNEAARLGRALEPWLIEQAEELISRLLPVDCLPIAERAPQRMYAHGEHTWRLCSPDGFYWPTPPYVHAQPAELIETKTAGLLTYRTPPGWTDTSIPLGYELQGRWQMHVMNADVCHVVALVAGRGLCHYPIARDPDVEVELVRQVDSWWQRYVVDGNEPPLSGRDGAMVAALYPRVERKTIDLDGTPALDWWQAYRDAHAEIADAETRKAEAGTALKALLGDAHTGLVDGRPIATWGERKGRVDWERIARDLYGQLVEVLNATDPKLARLTTFPMTHCLRCGQDMPFELHQAHAADGTCQPVTDRLPAIDAIAEQYRNPTTRTLTIKE